MFGQNLQPIGLPENANFVIKDNTISSVTGWPRKSVNKTHWLYMFNYFPYYLQNNY